jgi:hypothetical protein
LAHSWLWHGFHFTAEFWGLGCLPDLLIDLKHLHGTFEGMVGPRSQSFQIFAKSRSDIYLMPTNGIPDFEMAKRYWI